MSLTIARYGDRMIETAASQKPVESVESALRENLAQGEAIAGSIAPILRHFLANQDNSVFSDEIVARVRGMIGDLVTQLLDGLAAVNGEPDRLDHANADVMALTQAIVGDPALLRHVHALALEWQLTERLQSRLALDPVLPPFVQTLIASSDSEIAALAMKLLASQARFCQTQRRMKLPLAELPGDLLHNALVTMRSFAGVEADANARAASAESAIRKAYDEAHSRIGLVSRLVTAMGAGSIAALSICHGGLAIFLSALASRSGQDRDAAILATSETQLARLVLSLRAAGLKPEAVEEQFLAIHPDLAAPDGFERLSPETAATMLAASRGEGG